MEIFFFLNSGNGPWSNGLKCHFGILCSLDAPFDPPEETSILGITPTEVARDQRHQI